MKFKLIKNFANSVRIGKLETGHGAVNTPFFMPVATVGSVKGVSPQELKELGAQIVLSNTYHLYLRPGEKQIKKLGGLHQFMRWDGPILTDSGGYQVFSLGKRLDRECHSELDSESIKNGSRIESGMTKKNSKSLVKISEEGVEFTSHLDGSKHFFTPEKVIDIQLDLGVDILMPLDVCPSGKASREEVEEAVRLTIEWAKRSKLYFDRRVSSLKDTAQYAADKKQKDELSALSLHNHTTAKTIKQLNDVTIIPGLFGIVQGGLDPELRKYCAKELIKLDFDGYSIGGLAVDHETRDMWETVKFMGEILPENKPRYLMGVGTPDDIIKAMQLGVDMFDCVLPTRLARHGAVYIKNKNHKPIEKKSVIARRDDEAIYYKEIATPSHKGEWLAMTKEKKGNMDQYILINLLNSKYRSDGGVIEEGCDCPACSGGFSRAYISHLIRNNEILGLRLATLHNLYVYLELMKLPKKQIARNARGDVGP